MKSKLCLYNDVAAKTSKVLKVGSGSILRFRLDKQNMETVYAPVYSGENTRGRRSQVEFAVARAGTINQKHTTLAQTLRF